MAQIYSGWLRTLKAEQNEGLADAEVKTKSLLGAYANCPNLFLKRCREFEHWIMDQSNWHAPLLHARKVATVLVIHDIPDWKLLHTVTDARLVEWFRDDQCMALLRPLIDKLGLENEVEFRMMRYKRRRTAVTGAAKMMPGAVVLGQGFTRTTSDLVSYIGKETR